jgi:hypothetical protein
MIERRARVPWTPVALVALGTMYSNVASVSSKDDPSQSSAIFKSAPSLREAKSGVGHEDIERRIDGHAGARPRRDDHVGTAAAACRGSASRKTGTAVLITTGIRRTSTSPSPTRTT